MDSDGDRLSYERRRKKRPPGGRRAFSDTQIGKSFAAKKAAILPNSRSQRAGIVVYWVL